MGSIDNARGSDGCHKPVPVVGLFTQALAAGGGEFVELGAAIVLRCAPTRLEHPLTDQAEHAGIERALFDQQGIAGDLSNTQKDAVPMQRAERDRLEDAEIESAGKKLSMVGHMPSKLLRRKKSSHLECGQRVIERIPAGANRGVVIRDRM